jgi:hypothetical protein
MYYYCTYFDSGYLARGLALYESLVQHSDSFELWILCMDDTSYEALTKLELPGIRLISLEDLEESDPQLREARKTRSLIEYYFTCTPSLPLYILNSYPEVDAITYLDADLFFFADPSPLYAEIANNSIGIIEHRFPPHLLYKKKYGTYNVGFVFFKRDQQGLDCLRRWREQCLEWCYDRVEEDRFADQKYLDNWPNNWSGVVVLQHKGANLAPWNLSNYEISTRRKKVFVDEQPLIFFHFHGLDKVGNWLYEPNLWKYEISPSRTILKSIYKPYIKTLVRVAQQASSVAQPLRNGSRWPAAIETRSLAGSRIARRMERVKNELKWWWEVYRRIHEGRYILVVRGRSV